MVDAKHTAGPNRISGGAGNSMPACPSCPWLKADGAYPGWGWCEHPTNRVYDKAWTHGFTPSQSPTGSCEMHPARGALATSTDTTGEQ